MATMNRPSLFEFTCPECETGIVETTTIRNYRTKIKGYPFVVDEALIGVCNNCGAESFAPQELKRWEEAFCRHLEFQGAFLSPHDITELRSELQLSMEDFARLIGCTRQSISTWEKPHRTSAPSRMADLLMKLLRRSVHDGMVNVLDALLGESKKWGVVIEVRQSPRDTESATVTLRPKMSPEAPRLTGQLALAAKSADDKGQPIEMARTDNGAVVGKLEYDYASASLYLRLSQPSPVGDVVDIEFQTSDGKTIRQSGRQIIGGGLVLKEKTKPGSETVVSIKLSRAADSLTAP